MAAADLDIKGFFDSYRRRTGDLVRHDVFPVSILEERMCGRTIDSERGFLPEDESGNKEVSGPNSIVIVVAVIPRTSCVRKSNPRRSRWVSGGIPMKVSEAVLRVCRFVCVLASSSSLFPPPRAHVFSVGDAVSVVMTEYCTMFFSPGCCGLPPSSGSRAFSRELVPIVACTICCYYLTYTLVTTFFFLLLFTRSHEHRYCCSFSARYLSRTKTTIRLEGVDPGAL